MSNWYFFHHISRQSRTFHKRKLNLISGVVTLLLIVAGIWLMVFVLSEQDMHPFNSPFNSQENSAHTAFSPSVGYWQPQINAWAEEYDLDPLLVATVMQIESCGDPQALSPAGAHGLFQVMPYHFLPEENKYDPNVNAQRGLSYLRDALTKSNGDIQLALAGYNGGHGQIERDPNNWPDETQHYVHWGYGIYHESATGSLTGETLSAWLRAGGWRLCQSAEEHLGLP
jgi:hypothetical protein